MRVMRVLTRANVGGPARQLAVLEPELAARGVQELVVTGVVGGDERELDLGLPRIDAATARAAGTAAAGWCTLSGLGRALRPAADLTALRQLRELVRAFRPDVVHTHTSKAGVLGRLAAGAWRPAIRAHTFHGLVLRDYRGRLASTAARLAESALARRTGLLFAVSPSCAAELDELGVAPRAAVRVLRPAVAAVAVRDRDAARAELCRAARRPADAACVVGVGRSAAVKRPELFAALARLRPEVGFVWIGGSAADDHGAPNLAWLGWCDEPRRLLAAADALVLTSRREGYPVAGIEAASVGTPSLGFAVPGVTDLLAETGRGPGVPPAAGVAGLAAALDALLAAGAPRLAPESTRELLRATAPAAVAAELCAAYTAALGRRTPTPEPR